jgi:hypothetical protein
MDERSIAKQIVHEVPQQASRLDMAQLSVNGHLSSGILPASTTPQYRDTIISQVKLHPHGHQEEEIH